LKELTIDFGFKITALNFYFFGYTNDFASAFSLAESSVADFRGCLLKLDDFSRV